MVLSYYRKSSNKPPPGCLFSKMTFWVGLIEGGLISKFGIFLEGLETCSFLKIKVQFEVAKADGSSRSVLVHSKVVEQRAVTVHPLKR